MGLDLTFEEFASLLGDDPLPPGEVFDTPFTSRTLPEKPRMKGRSPYSDICTLEERRIEWDAKRCFDQANRLYQATYSDASAWALPVALVPIFIVWGLVYMAVWIVR